MKFENYHFNNDAWDKPFNVSLDSDNSLIICFANSAESTSIDFAITELSSSFPKAALMGCSTAGEIINESLFDNSLVVSVIQFEKTQLRLSTTKINCTDDSFDKGSEIANALDGDKLKAIFTLTDGLMLNGSAYVSGLSTKLPDDIIITGGMAADNDHFVKTWVLENGKKETSVISACGFYGDDVIVKHASRGGWDLLGIEREITSSKNNILFSLDGQPALALYKQYLGDRAKDLPGSGLLFPLAIKNEEAKDGLTVRTILAVNEEQQSITFAGDLPEGARVQLMRANFDRLIDGAANAGNALAISDVTNKAVCVAISCVGRRLVLGQRAEEELEVVWEYLPDNVGQIGFYSYGEISPLASGRCDLHNQTMTLSVFSES